VRLLAIRWLKFNFVGALGILVQLGVLALLVSGLRVPYLAATAVAVETAVLHNFVWHERFTWKDRTGRRTARQVAGRLVRFHAGNGAISLAGNLLLMRFFVGTLHLPYLPANIITIGICAFLNFAASEWFVFRK
jgi:putative flippase GtrA